MMIMITPSVLHFEELRSLLFDKIEEKEPDKLAKRAEKYFVIKNQVPLKFSAHINRTEDVEALLKMTPFYWKSSKEKKLKVLSLNELNITVSVNL